MWCLPHGKGRHGVTISRPHSQHEVKHGLQLGCLTEVLELGGTTETINTTATTIANICSVFWASAVQEPPHLLPTTNLQGGKILISAEKETETS